MPMVSPAARGLGLSELLQKTRVPEPEAQTQQLARHPTLARRHRRRPNRHERRMQAYREIQAVGLIFTAWATPVIAIVAGVALVMVAFAAQKV